MPAVPWTVAGHVHGRQPGRDLHRRRRGRTGTNGRRHLRRRHRPALRRPAGVRTTLRDLRYRPRRRRRVLPCRERRRRPGPGILSAMRGRWVLALDHHHGRIGRRLARCVRGRVGWGLTLDAVSKYRPAADAYFDAAHARPRKEALRRRAEVVGESRRLRLEPLDEHFQQRQDRRRGLHDAGVDGLEDPRSALSRTVPGDDLAGTLSPGADRLERRGGSWRRTVGISLRRAHLRVVLRVVL